MDELEYGEVLAARRLVYATLQALYGGEPEASLVQAVDPDVLAQAFDILGLDRTVRADESFTGDELVSDLSRLSDSSFLEETRSAYVRLFVGPAELDAPPWESVYRSSSRALFQRSTLDVRNAYREQGLLPERYPRVADDHISLELGFMAALAQRALDAAPAVATEDANGPDDAGDAPSSEDDSKAGVAAGSAAEALDVALEASKRFLDEHVLVWTDAYCRDLEICAAGTLYAPLARVTARFVAVDAALLDDLLAQARA